MALRRLGLICALLAVPAGTAGAEIAISGDARMGLAFDSSADPRIALINRIRIRFTAQGVTDGGLVYGIELDADRLGAAQRRGPAGRLSLSAGGHRLSFGAPFGTDAAEVWRHSGQ
jgi:outer membrane protein OmpU